MRKSSATNAVCVRNKGSGNVVDLDEVYDNMVNLSMDMSTEPVPELAPLSDMDSATSSTRSLSDMDMSHPHGPKSVTFSEIHIREYAVMIGDHPCCNFGCPVALDWKYSPATTLSLDKYEARRPPRCSRVRLRMTVEDRKRILCRNKGTTEADLRRAERKLHRARSCKTRLCEKAGDSFFTCGEEWA